MQRQYNHPRSKSNLVSGKQKTNYLSKHSIMFNRFIVIAQEQNDFIQNIH